MNGNHKILAVLQYSHDVLAAGYKQHFMEYLHKSNIYFAHCSTNIAPESFNQLNLISALQQKNCLTNANVFEF